MILSSVCGDVNLRILETSKEQVKNFSGTKFLKFLSLSSKMFIIFFMRMKIETNRFDAVAKRQKERESMT